MGMVVGVLSTTNLNAGDIFAYTRVGGGVLAKRRQPQDGGIVRLRGLQDLHDPRTVHGSGRSLIREGFLNHRYECE